MFKGRNPIWLILCLVWAGSLTAQTPAELVANGRVRVRAWLEPDTDIVANQQVLLYIETGTDRWFTGGTRIDRLEIQDVIVLRREQFATNFTEREGEQTWTMQRWSIALYPQRAGSHQIPPIGLTLSVSTGENETASGRVFTEPLLMEAGVPGPLSELETWVATTRFEVEETLDRSLQNLEPGDAIRRTVTFSADDVPAMMLPELVPAEIPGLAAYRKPPRAEDKSNRGIYRGERREHITYIVEKPGTYRLPELNFYWWDLAGESVNVARLPEHLITAGGAMIDAPAGESPEESVGSLAWLRGLPWTLIAIASTMLVVVSAGARALLGKRRRTPKITAPTVPGRALLRKQFLRDCRASRYTEAVATLYRWIDYYGDADLGGLLRPLARSSSDQDLAVQIDALMRAAYAEPAPGESHDTARIAALLKGRTRTGGRGSGRTRAELSLNRW